MKRSRHFGLFVSLSVLALTGGLALAVISDRLPTDSASWPGAAERAGVRARQQARAVQASEAWSQVLAEGLRCGGDMATVWAARPPAEPAIELPGLAQALRPIADRCRQRVPSLREVWLLPAPDRVDRAEPVLANPPSVPLGRLSERSLTRLREAIETEGERYAVTTGEGAGVDQMVPVRGRAGALLLLRLLPDATGEGSVLSHVLDEQANAQGVPIGRAQGLRVAIADVEAERAWLSSITLVLMALGMAAAIWHWRHQRDLQKQVDLAEAANDRLRDEFAFRQDIQEASPVGLRVIDLQGRITAVNQAFCEATGLTREALVDREPPYPFWPPEAHEERMHQLQDVLAGRSRDEGFRVELMHTGGSQWTAQVRATALHSGRGWLLTSEDVTEKVRRQSQIDRLHDELQVQGVTHVLGELSLQLVHDLSTPAKAIDQAAVNLGRLAQPALSGPMRVEVGVIRNQVVHQHRLIAFFTRQVRGELVYEPCDLRKVVDDAFALQSHEAARCNAELVNLVNKNLPHQHLARLSLLQVLLNLIGNALQSMRDTPLGSRLVVVRHYLVHEKPSPEYPTGREWLHLTVEDRGCGIAPDRFRAVFESGFSTWPDGRGLGLWLSRRWVERMGGQLAVKASSSDEGTVMHIVLPFQPPTGNASGELH